VAASHDRRFLATFGGEVWALRDGRLTPYADYAAYSASE
jgi:ATPase subunit of ABC transporter with duplicated ATPase domains